MDICSMDIMILGVRVDKINLSELRERCRAWLTNDAQAKQCVRVVTVNPEFVIEAQKNAKFREVLNTADCSIADGIGLFFASWLLYGLRSRLFRVTGVEFTWLLAELCSQLGKKIYLLGAGPGVAQKAAEVLKKKYPSLRIVGSHEGIPYIVTQGSKLFQEDLCRRITEAEPDVLLVAFGAPKQDIWIAEHASLLPTVKIAVGVGGTFDYIAGIVPYAPQWIRDIGFEWTYRLMTQPHRWRRIITAVIVFPLAIIKEKITRKK
ncbi:MAG: WecB/TagA/CpsF family glycosyltransferase [Candidatus Uhrbacteria bacterium]|nr:WecB/TagA/CpsF family glycosyltransferase [Candidatus Uhrbacteria bacterium]